MSSDTARDPLTIGGKTIRPGTRVRLEIPISERFTGADVNLPVEIIHGKADGPRLFVSAAVHGDEINGVEIIRRILRRTTRRSLRGTLIAVPIVNVFGFVALSRYLPDRRDLNRSFPGSTRGSLAARLAHVFLAEIVANATHGIDLHTGAVHRSNLPQIRACLDDAPTDALARAFGVPVMLNSDIRDGSLRQEVLERKMPMLVYEGGEALRFDERAIRAGVYGVQSVMHSLGMTASSPRVRRHEQEPFIARSNHWIRAPQAGILRTRVRLGARVREGATVGVVADPLGIEETVIESPYSGIVIGRTELPLVNEGDALFNIGVFDRPHAVASSVRDFHEHIESVRTTPS